MTEKVNFTIDKERRKEVLKLTKTYGISESAMINFMIGKFLAEEKK